VKAVILNLDDWQFQIFPVATRKYYARELAEHCDCAVCRNFYAAVDKTYPHLRSFLEMFAVQVEAPDQMDRISSTLYTNYYAVRGSILKRGQGSIPVDGISVDPMEEEEAMADTWMEGPLFFLSVGTMKLPWVLEEAPPEEPTGENGSIGRILGRWITETE
jgi:hypothetical protein